METLCSELLACVFQYLPTAAKCAAMATCHRIHDDVALRTMMGVARRIHRRTKSRHLHQSRQGHASQARRVTHKKYQDAMKASTH